MCDLVSLKSSNSSQTSQQEDISLTATQPVSEAVHKGKSMSPFDPCLHVNKRCMMNKNFMHVLSETLLMLCHGGQHLYLLIYLPIFDSPI